MPLVVYSYTLERCKIIHKKIQLLIAEEKVVHGNSLTREKSQLGVDVIHNCLLIFLLKMRVFHNFIKSDLLVALRIGSFLMEINCIMLCCDYVRIIIIGSAEFECLLIYKSNGVRRMFSLCSILNKTN